jgi:hypothetical protein
MWHGHGRIAPPPGQRKNDNTLYHSVLSMGMPRIVSKPYLNDLQLSTIAKTLPRLNGDLAENQREPFAGADYEKPDAIVLQK